MGGGLLNIVSYGNQNIILNGNPSKTHFKCVYSKYTNFGLQKFRIDCVGNRNLRETDISTIKFKIPKHADLLMDTYLIINLPTIWSPILPPTNRDTDTLWKPYEFKWIKDIGTQLIERVRFVVGGIVIQEYTGQYLRCLVERDFDSVKKDLYYKMTGNVQELNDPANAFDRRNNYPNVYPTNVPNYSTLGPEPSIYSRKLYIPINIWFTLASKMAFPIVCLGEQELSIEFDLKPIDKLFTTRDIADPTNNGQHIKPNFNNLLFQFYRFLQPPPWKIDNKIATLQKWVDKRTIWNADIHLISTFAFLSNDEIKVFTENEQTYLIKQAHYYKHENIIESKKINLFSTSGLVVNWMWYFQRNDANLRNQWSNYSNWAYEMQPVTLVDPYSNNVLASHCNVTPANNANNVNNVNNVNNANNANNIVGFNANYKISNIYTKANQKNIMISWALSIDGKYRENIQDAGVIDYIEKYSRTDGNAPEGLYCYNFCLNTNPVEFLPSGAMNLTKFNQIQFEFKTYVPELDQNAKTLTLCDDFGNFIGVNKSMWRIHNYTYDLFIMEERYNCLSIKDFKTTLFIAN